MECGQRADHQGDYGVNPLGYGDQDRDQQSDRMPREKQQESGAAQHERQPGALRAMRIKFAENFFLSIGPSLFL